MYQEVLRMYICMLFARREPHTPHPATEEEHNTVPGIICDYTSDLPTEKVTIQNELSVWQMTSIDPRKDNY